MRVRAYPWYLGAILMGVSFLPGMSEPLGAQAASPSVTHQTERQGEVVVHKIVGRPAEKRDYPQASPGQVPQKSRSLKVVAPPKDGNEGTYPTYKPEKKKSAPRKVVAPPKDGNEGTYPTYKPRPPKKSTAPVAPSQPPLPAPAPAPAPAPLPAPSLDGAPTSPQATPAPEQGVRQILEVKAPEAKEEPPSPKVDTTRPVSLPFRPKDVQVLEKAGEPLLWTHSQILQLQQSSALRAATPSYFLDNSQGNIEIPEFRRLKVRYNLRRLGAQNLLLLAYHLPFLPSEGQRAARGWILKGESGIKSIDLRGLPTGVYKVVAVALNGSYQPVAKPNLDRMNISYGGQEALIDYQDRQTILTKGRAPAMGFQEIEVADPVAELPLYKIVPATSVLKPGEKIVLSVELLPTSQERRRQRIHARYGSQALKESEEKNSAAPQKPEGPRRFHWEMVGHGRLQVISDTSAIYYAPTFDMTGAEIRCWEEGTDNVVTASMFVTTMPIGEMPSLKELAP